MKISLNELLAIAIRGFNEGFRFAFGALSSFHNAFNALLERGNNSHCEAELPRQNEPRAATHNYSAFMLSSKQHDFSKSADVFRLRDKLFLEPLAEHFMKP